MVVANLVHILTVLTLQLLEGDKGHICYLDRLEMQRYPVESDRRLLGSLMAITKCILIAPSGHGSMMILLLHQQVGCILLLKQQ